MKKHLLLLAWLLAGVLSCYKAPQKEDIPDEHLYIGTVSVDFEGSTFDNESIYVACVPSEDGSSADIVIYRIKFVPRMPVRIDVTIPGVQLRESGGKTLLSCDDVNPLAMGGEYAKYRVSGLEGSLAGNELSFSLNFGDCPTRFTGFALR